MKQKFKINDRVKINESQDVYNGLVGVITCIDTYKLPYRVDFKNEYGIYHEQELELVINKFESKEQLFDILLRGFSVHSNKAPDLIISIDKEILNVAMNGFTTNINFLISEYGLDSFCLYKEPAEVEPEKSELPTTKEAENRLCEALLNKEPKKPKRRDYDPPKKEEKESIEQIKLENDDYRKVFLIACTDGRSLQDFIDDSEYSQQFKDVIARIMKRFEQENDETASHGYLDLVEVVRCGECMHTKYEDKSYCEIIGTWVEPDHYCGYGEKK